MERFCESVLTLTGSLGLLLTTDGRLLVMLSLTNLSDNASSRALPLESPQSTFQGFILTNTDLRHLSIPPLGSIIRRSIASNQPSMEYRTLNYSATNPIRQRIF